MRDFSCPNCGSRLAFENSRCLTCGLGVGIDLARRDFVLVSDDDAMIEQPPMRWRCLNKILAVCNWVAPAWSTDGLCESCTLTRTRPADQDLVGLTEFADAEAAKRRLVFELAELGLALTPRALDEEHGVAFDLLSSAGSGVVTGHDSGVITLDLAESDDAHREQLRESMDEPYRTVLGHFRHEIGHYFYEVLAASGPARADFERLFGDPDADYQAAIDRHYAQGPPPNWAATFISAYATMHPAEDWAETFAHYLHIRDTLDTSAAFGVAPASASLRNRFDGPGGLDEIIDLWIPVTWTLNMVNRSMGYPDLYPFVVPPAALDKMRLVHESVARRRRPDA